MRGQADHNELPSLYAKIALVSAFAAVCVHHERGSSEY